MHGTRFSPAISVPGIWLTDLPFHTWAGGCFPSRGVVVLSASKAQSKTLLSKAPELLLPQPCWDAEGHNMRPSFRSNCYPEIKKCSLIYICWYLAGVTAVSGMEYFCPAFYCNLEEEELYPLQWVQISSAFLLKAWQAGSFKFVSTTEFINFTSNQVYHHDLNLVPAWAKM